MIDFQQIINTIYKDVFCNTYNQSCYIFLCGGADDNSIRDSVKNILTSRRFHILYPEDLFMEMLNRDKRSDLLEYENFLADNSDIICIICESMGSAVELGAFVQNEAIKKKLVVVINKKYSREKSFIMMGPIKHLRKSNDNSIVLYKSGELLELCDKLSKQFRKVKKNSVSNKNCSFDELTTYIAFLPVILFFFKKIERKQLHKELKIYLNNNNMLPSKYNELFNATINYLLKTGIITTDFCHEKSEVLLSLSSKGYRETKKLLSNSCAKEKTILHDRIRCGIMKEQLNN